MRRILGLRAAAAMLTAVLAVPAAGAHDGEVVVANRVSGTVMVSDAMSGAELGTHAVADGGEPMSVTATADGSRVFVGDRANDRVVVFDGDDYSVVGTVAAGAGALHMRQDPDDRQPWVNNDIDNTATVIDPISVEVIAAVPMPADVVDAGYKPHDVVVDPTGPFASVTLIGGATNDWLIQFNTRSFQEVKRAAVGLDPPVSLTSANGDLDVSGAHGAGMSPNGSVFSTTNLPGGGSDELFAIDTDAVGRSGVRPGHPVSDHTVAPLIISRAMTSC